VLVSNAVYDHVRDRLPFAFEDLGEHEVKKTESDTVVLPTTSPPVSLSLIIRRKCGMMSMPSVRIARKCLMSP
jgi:class 3 adenylate cyclase